jgi:hypothetical protein
MHGHVFCPIATIFSDLTDSYLSDSSKKWDGYNDIKVQ